MATSRPSTIESFFGKPTFSNRHCTDSQPEPLTNPTKATNVHVFLSGNKRPHGTLEVSQSDVDRKTREQEEDRRFQGALAFTSLMNEVEAIESAGVKRRKQEARKPTRADTTKKLPKGGKINGLTLEQHRRALGDAVKHNITVEKWAIEARTHCVIPNVPLAVFQKLVVPEASAVVPSEFSASTAVVVANVKGPAAAGAVFGATKIKGGTRMGSWSADNVDLIYFPPSGELRIGWTMR